MSNKDSILTYFKYFWGYLWPYFIFYYVKGINVGDAYIGDAYAGNVYVKDAYIRSWVLLSCGKSIIC